MMGDFIIWNELGNIYLQLGSHDEAIAAYLKAVELAPEYGQAHNNLALAYCRKGNYRQALLSYRRCLELFESSVDQAAAWRGLSEVYEQMGDRANAVVARQHAKLLGAGLVVENHDESQEVSSNAEEPANVKPSGELVDWLQGLVAQTTPLVDVDNSDQDFQKWLQSREAKDRPSSNTALRLEEGPDRSDSESGLVSQEPQASADSGREGAGNGLSEISPAKPMGFPFLEVGARPFERAPASALLELEQSPSLVWNAEVATPQAASPASELALNPMRERNEDTLADLSNQPEEEVQVDGREALQGVAEAAALPSDLPASPSSVVESRPREKTQQEIELETNLSVYEKITTVAPTNDRAWDTLGKLYKGLGRYSEALSAFERAISLSPAREAYHYHLGLVYAAQKRHQEAVLAFQEVLNLNPEYVLAHCALAGSYRRLGMDAEADKHVAVARPVMDTENEYNRACFEAICGNVDESIELLKAALEKRQTLLEWVRSDPDLDFIRDDPRFQALVDQVE
jgi:tetratricopeptide (TPR) repeat protein